MHMKTNKLSEYPRPQFVRNNWINLNGMWDFLFDDENIGEINKYYENFKADKKILVPFTYETELSGISCVDIHNNIWYAKEVDLSINNNQKLFIHFEGSDYITKLWINGKYVGENVGAYHRFSFDITDYVYNGINKIVVKVEDTLSKSQPRGKQRYKSESFKCWYIQTTGIWKTVWLEYTDNDYIEYAKVTPNYDNKTIDFEFNFNISNIINKEIEILIKYKDKITNSFKREINEKKEVINIDIDKKREDVKKWSPDNPNLYYVVYRLYNNGVLCDEVFSYFGVRKIETTNKILLNENEIYLKMILDQGYWDKSHLTIPSVDAIEKDIEIVKKYGFNGIRKHQKIEDERFLYYCDMKGILVFCEMPSMYEFNDESITAFTNEWMKVIKQNYNHPSIITWVPFNESWGVKEIVTNVKMQSFVNSIFYLTKAYDCNRLVIGNDGYEHTLSDIITIHDYKQDADLIKEDYCDDVINNEIINNNKAFNGKHILFSNNYKYHNQPIIISEYGGIALSSDKGWGYGKMVNSEDEFFKRFESITNAFKNIGYIYGYCYTQLTDVQQEINGLVTIDRKDKFSKNVIRKIQKVNR